MANSISYWGFRVDVYGSQYPQYYNEELKRGFLRQGWGLTSDHDLRQLSKNPEEIPKDMQPNMRMYDKVKKGDVLLIPRIPKWTTVTIARATEDWNRGYDFKIDSKWGDFGHKFPAEFVKAFTRQNKHVSGPIRRTLKARGRFWNVGKYKEDIDLLVDCKEDLVGDQDRGQRFKGAVHEALSKSNLDEILHETLSKQFVNQGWEYALASGLQALFRDYQIERTAGPEEAKHGTDILVTIPGLTEGRLYGIAIQVKDYVGNVDLKEPMEQIRKSEEYWKQNRGVDVIERVIIITGKNVDSKELQEKQDDVTILYGKDLQKLLLQMALATGTTIVSQESGD